MNVKASSAVFVTIVAATLIASCSRDAGTAGIDGTGVRSPDIVSYGRVTAFGSVWINGVRYDTSDTTVVINGAAGSLPELDVGDVVLLRGTLDPDGDSGRAATIELDHILTGPVESIDEDAGVLVALGQSVKITSDTVFDPSVPLGSAAGLNAGDIIQVSGFHDVTGRIAAARLGKPAVNDGQFKAAGPVTNLDEASTRFNINALTVDYGGAVFSNLTAIRNGDLLEVNGMLSAATGVLAATRMEGASNLIAGGPGDRVDVEGYLTTFDASNPLTFAVAGLSVKVNDATEFEGNVTLDAPLEVEGSLDSEGTLIARDVRSSAPRSSGLHSIYGYVFEPQWGSIADMNVNLFVYTATGGYSYWWSAGRPLRSDAAGHFVANTLPDSRAMILAAGQLEDFVQPCAVTVDLKSSVAVNVEVMHVSALEAFNPPRPLSAAGQELTGTIFETTEAGRQPVAGARLWAEDLIGVGMATTRSDLGGRFFLCNLPWPTRLWVSKDGYETLSIEPIDVSQSIDIEIELTRANPEG